MLSGGDWVIPHLNGIAYVEKPPLQYWATALTLLAFGQNEFAARVLHGAVRARDPGRGVGPGAATLGVRRRHGGRARCSAA